MEADVVDPSINITRLGPFEIAEYLKDIFCKATTSCGQINIFLVRRSWEVQKEIKRIEKCRGGFADARRAQGEKETSSNAFEGSKDRDECTKTSCSGDRKATLIPGTIGGAARAICIPLTLTKDKDIMIRPSWEESKFPWGWGLLV